MIRVISLMAIAATLSLPAIAAAGQVLVAVAANFTDATRDIEAMFERATGHEVRVSYGSTGKLYAQIEHGAPFDLFLAADSGRPAKAERDGLGVPGTRFTYALGRLVLWSRKTGLFVDGESYLAADPARIAIANPATAPYGAAARQVMERLGVWERLQGRVVKGDSIAQTFQFAATGNVDAGFVALSQIQRWQGGEGSRWLVPESYHSPIAQQAVLLRRGENNPAAIALHRYLQGPEAGAVIEDYGYMLEAR